MDTSIKKSRVEKRQKEKKTTEVADKVFKLHVNYDKSFDTNTKI